MGLEHEEGREIPNFDFGVSREIGALGKEELYSMFVSYMILSWDCERQFKENGKAIFTDNDTGVAYSMPEETSKLLKYKGFEIYYENLHNNEVYRKKASEFLKGMEEREE
jgi:hypothetical protein